MRVRDGKNWRKWVTERKKFFHSEGARRGKGPGFSASLRAVDDGRYSSGASSRLRGNGGPGGFRLKDESRLPESGT